MQRRTANARDPETRHSDLTLDCVTDAGTFEGYASLFEREDLGHDVIKRGAFRASLAKRGASGLRMLFQHDPGQPIGTWDRVYEDARGLFVRGRLTLASSRARDVHALMRSGAIDGLSIGFRTITGVRDPRSRIRRLMELDLWEISVVTFPMMPEARVEGVKRSQPIPTESCLGRTKAEAFLVGQLAEAAHLLRKPRDGARHGI
jgi:uncharacterized protein